ncbi:MAG: hypothetical protein EZS28_035906 [Streblomastix strix]|uniref:Uncharacterized protein n=1 Tax=Streblomastix strix TaxID=222440 RepID=A0A5J4UDQ6_9EUKA|nr:MAG: hypothetical protein EZS28_035906 [Streblomastix strix]
MSKIQQLYCCICAGMFGIGQITHHIVACAKKWNDQQSKFPLMCQSLIRSDIVLNHIPKSLDDQQHAMIWNKGALQAAKEIKNRCPHCNTAIAPEKFILHIKKCLQNPVNSPDQEMSRAMNPSLIYNICGICGYQYDEKEMPVHTKKCFQDYMAEQRKYGIDVENEIEQRKRVEPSYKAQMELIENLMKMAQIEEKKQQTVIRGSAEERSQRIKQQFYSGSAQCQFCKRRFHQGEVQEHMKYCVNKPVGIERPTQIISLDHPEDEGLDPQQKEEVKEYRKALIDPDRY